jgi:superfamily II DNA or RNA helicase
MVGISLGFEFEEPIAELEFEEFIQALPLQGFRLREYQTDALNKIRDAWTTHNRILAVLATGCGKTVIFSSVAREIVDAGGRVLILAHTDELLEQAMAKLEGSTGLSAEKEKADSYAGLSASVVVASIQTLTRTNRLTGFPDDHFDLVIVDEAHRSLAKSYIKVLSYFHFGARSLDEEWRMPAVGEAFEHKARVLGVTATADRGDKRSLGEFYQECVVDYGLLQAVQDGYLVRPVTHNIPLQIDLRGVKVSRGPGGSDYDVREVVERITPFLREAARNIAAAAFDRKTVVFLPSIDTAKLMSAALCEMGLTSEYISGQCANRKEKLEWFADAGNGSCICNAMLLTEGWDCPDVSAICVLRPTKIRGLYVQCVGRGTRPLPGVVDGLKSAAERIAAIAFSQKPDLRIIDFLWLSDRLDLIQSVDLVATSPEVRAKMLANQKSEVDGPGMDLIEAGASAERDLLESLEKAAKEHSKKKTRVIDPLAWAVALGDDALQGWEPSTKWEALSPTPGQLEALEKAGIDIGKIKMRGLASKLLDRISARRKANLCTPKQLNMMIQLGLSEASVSMLSFTEAHATIDATLSAKNSRPKAPTRSSV